MASKSGGDGRSGSRLAGSTPHVEAGPSAQQDDVLDSGQPVQPDGEGRRDPAQLSDDQRYSASTHVPLSRSPTLAERLAAKRSDLEPPRVDWHDSYPLLWQAFCPGKDAKGRKIDSAFVSITVNGDAWQIGLSLPLGGLRTSFIIHDPSDLWDELERRLREPNLVSWRDTRKVPPHLRPGG